MKEDISWLFDRLRYRYSNWWDNPFKWIRRIEIGAQGGIHCHALINQVKGADVDLEIQKLWNKRTGGRVHFERFKADEESAHKVGDYLVKPLTENQIKRAEELDITKKELSSYSTSKNLERPKPKRKIYKRRNLRRLVETGEPKARKGFYIDKSSIVFGVNPYTGLSYCYYTEIRADGGELP